MIVLLVACANVCVRLLQWLGLPEPLAIVWGDWLAGLAAWRTFGLVLT